MRFFPALKDRVSTLDVINDKGRPEEAPLGQCVSVPASR
jgi:hypothetical protein